MKISVEKLLYVIAIIFTSCNFQEKFVDIKVDVMEDKVRGGWAGKMIGVMYGRPMEFAVADRMYTDSIDWDPQNVELALFEDDIYGQLNFMSTMERYGQDVDIDSLAKNFAYAEFDLCHANLQARKNYLDGIKATDLSLPCNSIHCEDIDFQIESDFIGFINPCMPVSSNEMCSKVGAIMSAADGMYAGMFVCAMHTLAYRYDNLTYIVKEAMKAIPVESGYYRCIDDVVKTYYNNPDDWVDCWNMLADKWMPYDICTPYLPFNIDAKLNGAYVVMGLLYGGGDWDKTMEITVRCGQDTDCNTATAAAVLGIANGYDAIPDKYKSHIPAISDSCFVHTDYSFNKAVSQTLKFIKENVEKTGGTVNGKEYRIKLQSPVAAPYIKGFDNLIINEVVCMNQEDKWQFEGQWQDFVYGDGDYALYKMATEPGDSMSITFTGTGVALMGSWNTDGGRARVYLDGNPAKIIDTYYVKEAGKYEGNRAYLFYEMGLDNGNHTLSLVNLEENNPRSTGHKLYIEKILSYQ